MTNIIVHDYIVPHVFIQAPGLIKASIEFEWEPARVLRRLIDPFERMWVDHVYFYRMSK